MYMSSRLAGFLGVLGGGVALLCPLPALATVDVATIGRTSPVTAALPAVTFTDRVGDQRLTDGLPNDPKARSIDIRSVRFEKVGGTLRVTTTMRSVGGYGTQYVVATATTPSGLKFLIQASTNTSIAYVAKQSWANEVRCGDAKGRRDNGSPGSITAVVPLGCLGRPARLSQFTAYTVVEDYSVSHGRTLELADDEAAGGGVLRLR